MDAIIYSVIIIYFFIMNLKKIGVGLMALTFALSGTVVLAETGSDKDQKKTNIIQKIEESARKKIEKVESEMIRRGEYQPIILEVGPKGKALIRGKIESISTTTGSTTGVLKLKSWGGSWTVNVYSDTEVAGNNRTLNGWKVGDYVGARGQIDPDKTLTIDATVVRNWSNAGEVRIQKIEDKTEKKIEKVERSDDVPSTFVPAITAEKAKELALIALPGKTIIKVELDKEEGKIVWSVRFDGERRVDIDATTGAVVRVK